MSPPLVALGGGMQLLGVYLLSTIRGEGFCRAHRSSVIGKRLDIFNRYADRRVSAVRKVHQRFRLPNPTDDEEVGIAVRCALKRKLKRLRQRPLAVHQKALLNLTIRTIDLERARVKTDSRTSPTIYGLLPRKVLWWGSAASDA